jgi:hypothetical protein
MTKHEKIVAGLKRIAEENGGDYLLDGEVDEVDAEAYTCDVVLETDGSTIYGCRLRATATDANSIDVLPTVGAAVVIAKMGGEDYLVLACDEITSFKVTVGVMVLTVDENGFGLSNGGDSLKSIMSDLVTGVLSIYAPKDVTGITALTARIEDLLQ